MVKHSNNNDNPTIIHPPHYLHELPQEDEERLENLFRSIDVDGNGRIDIHDLSVALREFGVNQQYAKKFIERSDQNKSGDVCLGEFIHYVREHEKNLRLQFSHLDKNKDGKIDVEELIRAFKDLGVDIDTSEAMNLLQRMDQDGSLAISFDEWRDFLLYAPSTDIIEIIKYWRHSTAFACIIRCELTARFIVSWTWCGSRGHFMNFWIPTEDKLIQKFIKSQQELYQVHPTNNESGGGLTADVGKSL